VTGKERARERKARELKESDNRVAGHSAGGVRRRRFAPPHCDLAAPGRHLALPLPSAPQVPACHVHLLASHRLESVGFEPEGATRGLELCVRVGLRNVATVVSFPGWAEMNNTFGVAMD
jgi:hypothetical protein